MMEPEVFFPVRCPVCAGESLAGFRLTVVAEALEVGQIRLYTSCHVASWDASAGEIKTMRDYVYATWGPELLDMTSTVNLALPDAWPRRHDSAAAGSGVPRGA